MIERIVDSGHFPALCVLHSSASFGNGEGPMGSVPLTPGTPAAAPARAAAKTRPAARGGAAHQVGCHNETPARSIFQVLQDANDNSVDVRRAVQDRFYLREQTGRMDAHETDKDALSTRGAQSFSCLLGKHELCDAADQSEQQYPYAQG